MSVSSSIVSSAFRFQQLPDVRFNLVPELALGTYFLLYDPSSPSTPWQLRPFMSALLPPGTTQNQVLQWNGTAWVPFQILPPGTDEGDLLYWHNGAWTKGTNVNILPTASTVFQTLQWNGAVWLAGEVLPPGINTGDQLTWNGTAWYSANPSGPSPNIPYVSKGFSLVRYSPGAFLTPAPQGAGSDTNIYQYFPPPGAQLAADATFELGYPGCFNWGNFANVNWIASGDTPPRGNFTLRVQPGEVWRIEGFLSGLMSSLGGNTDVFSIALAWGSNGAPNVGGSGTSPQISTLGANSVTMPTPGGTDLGPRLYLPLSATVSNGTGVEQLWTPVYGYFVDTSGSPGFINWDARFMYTFLGYNTLTPPL